jgi:hypothetical protein
MMRDSTAVFNRQENKWLRLGSTKPMDSGKSWCCGGKNLNSFCPTKEMAFAAWNEELDPESGFPRTATTGPADA